MATDFIGALSAGSGVDVKALAQSLVDVEKAPREAAFNSKVDDHERRIAGYSALMLSLQTVKTAFQKLNDLNDFNAATVNNSQPSVMTAATTSSAIPGRHTIEVQQLAQAQRDASNAFTTATQTLNSAEPFSVRLTLDGAALSSVRVATPTPQGIVDAINESKQGVTAQLVDTGDASNPYTITLAGPVGADGVFSFATDDAAGSAQSDTLTFQAATATGTITIGGVAVNVTAGQTASEVAEAARVALAASALVTGVSGRSIAAGATTDTLTLQWAASDGASPSLTYVDSATTGVGMTAAVATAFVGGASVSGVSLANSNLQSAQNAEVLVNGLLVTRSVNSLDAVIPGVYIDLLASNVGTPLDLRITRDTAVIKENLQAAVDTYNNAISDFGVLAGERSDDTEDLYSGSLANDSTLRRVKSQLRDMFVDNSTTGGDTIKAFRNLGLDIDRAGVMSLDSTKLEAALSTNFSEVVNAFSANTNSQTEFGSASRGIAGDAIKMINDLISSRGSIVQQSQGAQSQIDSYTEKLEELDTRMAALLTRYTKQFGVMEAFVGQSNSMRDSLKSTFEGMMSVYTNK
jgi:flagellar hook-associated protein 2